MLAVDASLVVAGLIDSGEDGRAVSSKRFPMPRLHPILNTQARHPGEFPHIVCDKDQPFAAGMSSDLHVVGAAQRARAFQFRS
jgi:hypothetical protein